MKKLLFKLSFLLILLLPGYLQAQDITGLWKGELYVDSTKQYLPFELSISEVKGKLVGYSHITFEENGKKETGLRDVTIQRKANEVIIEDVSLLDNSFSFTPPKNIKKTMIVTLSLQDTIMVLKGSWSTNRTKRFLSATGTVQMQRKNDFKETVLFKKLEELKLADKLVFNEPEKKPVNTLAATQQPAIQKITAPDASAIDKKPEEIKAATPPPAAVAAAMPKPAETKSIPVTAAPSAPMAAVVNKPEEIKKSPPVVSSPMPTTPLIVAKTEEVKKTPPVVNKPAPTDPLPIAKTEEVKKTSPVVNKPAPVTTPPVVSAKPIAVTNIPPVNNKPASPVAVVNKPVEIAKAPPVVNKPTPSPVVTVPAVVPKPLPPAAAPVEKNHEHVIPGTVQGAADVDKRTIASTQAVYYQSDSLVLTLYDNGYVDGDTVSVVMNGEVIFSKQGLSTKAVSKTIYITKDTPDSIKLVMYAENLGSIPPNTGLLVVHDGDNVYDVRFSADLKSNAAIILQRKKQ